MFDRRYPNLCRIEDATRLSSEQRARLSAYADSICKRTGSSVAYNRSGDQLFFFLGVRGWSGEGYALPEQWVDVFNPDGTFNGRLNTATADRVVKVIQTGKWSVAERERADEYRKNTEKSNATAKFERDREYRQKQGLARVKRLMNQKGMSSKFRPMVTVDGFKGE